MKWIIAVLLVLVYALHQDSWFIPGAWTNDTLFFGILPYGLAYHAGYSVLAALTMAFLVKTAWPAKLEAQIEAEHPETADRAPGH